MVRRYGAITAVNDVSIQIERGEIHGLLGHNGAGKSTLVKLLAGLETPDEGTLAWEGVVGALDSPQKAQRAGVALVHQELSLIPTLTVAENLVLGRLGEPVLRRRGRLREQARGLLAMVGLEHIDPDERLGRLSLGERQLVEIARALGRKARLLILDEPTATLSDAEIRSVFAAVRRLAEGGTSVLFVSHRLGEVLELCGRITVMREGSRIVTRGVDGLTRSELVELILGHPDEAAPPVRVVEAGKPLVSIRGLCVVPRVNDFDLELSAGEVVVLAGQIGSGAEDVLRGLAGLVHGTKGDVTVGDRRVHLGWPRRAFKDGVIYLSKDRKSEGLFMGHRVDRNLTATRIPRLAQRGLITPQKLRGAARRLAETVGVIKRVRSRVTELSGGNQQKVFMGRNMQHGGGRLILLDEPTRGVDVGGRAEIHALMRRTAGEGNAVLFVSTDLEEIMEAADIVVTMFAGRIVSVRRRDLCTPSQVVADMTHAERSAA